MALTAHSTSRTWEHCEAYRLFRIATRCACPTLYPSESSLSFRVHAHSSETLPFAQPSLYLPRLSL